jgi:hypothetical protein
MAGKFSYRPRGKTMISEEMKDKVSVDKKYQCPCCGGKEEYARLKRLDENVKLKIDNFKMVIEVCKANKEVFEYELDKSENILEVLESLYE